MKLESLTMTNFRRFASLEVTFHPELTVLVARNGQGKTSVLDAATTAIGTFAGAFDQGKAKHIDQRDARYQRSKGRADSEQIFPVRLETHLADLIEPITRELNGPKGRTTIKDAAPLTEYGKLLMDAVRHQQSVELPLLAYYGSGRLWNTHKNMSRKAVLSESRTMGYEDCFSSASSFTQVQQWMTKATFAALQQESMEAYKDYNLPKQIEGIQRTVDSVLQVEGWEGFHYSLQHEELAMTHEELGVLPVSMLSDGVRAMVSLVADMAWRCAKLNPQLGEKAQTETEGVAFIDEVDMHLHPKWQQTVISSLRKAFPKIQIIVTTHSPQVLSTVDAESIRVIQSEFDRDTDETKSEAVTPSTQSRGVASHEVMAELQGIDPVPRVEEAGWLQEYKTLLAKPALTPEQQERMDFLRDKILEHFGEHHSEWQECERLKRLRDMKKKLNTSK